MMGIHQAVVQGGQDALRDPDGPGVNQERKVR